MLEPCDAKVSRTVLRGLGDRKVAWLLGTECDPIDRTGMDAEANDPARVLIHNDQDPVGPQRGRLAAEQIHTPEAVFHVTQQREPGGPSGARLRQNVMGENPPHHVFVDWDVEGQGDLFSDSRTAPARIPLLHFHNRMDEFCTRSGPTPIDSALVGGTDSRSGRLSQLPRRPPSIDQNRISCNKGGGARGKEYDRARHIHRLTNAMERSDPLDHV